MTPPRIVFMGTPEFSVFALKALHEKGYMIPVVITQPDRPKGRGRVLMAPPVKEAALSLGLPVIQPEKVNDTSVVDSLQKMEPDFFVVVAFGQFLSTSLLSLPQFAPINIHASLLPEYRGSAPIHRAILNGDTLTGVTTMFMDKGMDSGDILQKTPIAIEKNDTTSTLHDKLAIAGAELIISTIEGFIAGTVNRTPQDHHLATHAPMLKKKEGQIDWKNSAEKIDCFVRGMTPWPGAYTYLDNQRLKICRVAITDTHSDAPPGTILPTTPEKLFVASKNWAISILEIQGASGKRLKTADFLRGKKINAGQVFS